MDAVILVGLWLFAITHIDTLVVLLAFFLDETYGRHEILIGHYLGFTTGLLAAILAAVVAAEVLEGWTFLLGAVPLALGLWGLVHRRPNDGPSLEPLDVGPVGRIGVVTSAGIGLSGENLAVFIPYFAERTTVELGWIVLVYLLAAAVVYFLALVGARQTASSVELPGWVETRLVPGVLVVVGLYVLATGWAVA